MKLTAFEIFSSLGASHQESLKRFSLNKPNFSLIDNTAVFKVSDSCEEKLENLLSIPSFNYLNDSDRVTKLAVTCSKYLLDNFQGNSKNLSEDLVVIACSARGATEYLEKTISDFKNNFDLHPRTSPNTTLGNIASSVASLFEAPPISFGTSMTCSSFMQGIFIANALIKSEQANRVLLVGVEAPLTLFTIAQMKALKIYSLRTDSFPCRPFDEDLKHRNTLVLGEGCAAFLFESEKSLSSTESKVIASLNGLGMIQERNQSATGIDPEGKSLTQAMKNALDNNHPDLLIAHAPGTNKGDLAEKNAIISLLGEEFFSNNVISTKHLTGHTFGASVGLSLGIGLLTALSSNGGKKNFLVNGAGFGGVVGSSFWGV